MIPVIFTHFFQSHTLSLPSQSVHIYKLIQKYDSPDFRDRIHDKLHVYIITVLIDPHTCSADQLCSYGHGMHFNKRFFRNIMKIVFSAIFHPLKRMSVLNTSFSGLFIDPEKIGPHNICFCLFKIFHKCDKAFFVYPVITVQHFHIFPNCIIHTCVDCRSMAPIGLTDHPDGIWMCFCIFHRNLFRPVC